MAWDHWLHIAGKRRTKISERSKPSPQSTPWPTLLGDFSCLPFAPSEEAWSQCGWKPYDLHTGAKAIRYRNKWPVFRGGSTPVSTILRKWARFFIINIFLIIIIIIELSKMVWTNVFFFQFPGIKQKPGKGNFRDLKSQNITGGACPRAPLEACSLGPSFRKSVSVYPRSVPGVCRHGVVTLDRKVSVKRRKEWTDCLAVVSCSHSYRCSNLC